VVFADVRADTLTIDVGQVESLITPRTRAIVAVDYGGLPADLGELADLAQRHRITLVEDACHAPGAEYRGRRVGAIAHLTAFSFHPVKHLTTAEGGMVSTNDAALAERLRAFRNHGIATDHRQRQQAGTWEYDMAMLGYNYRLNDVQCALGLSQLQRLPQTLARRRVLAGRYQRALTPLSQLRLPAEPQDRRHAWHLYAIRINGEDPAPARRRIFGELRAGDIGVNVHYLPVYLHSYYRALGYQQGLCPVAEHAYAGLVSLPMWHGLTDVDQDRVIDTLARALKNHG
jgi:perosamine synthetase